MNDKTHSDMILSAARDLVHKHGKETFTRQDIMRNIGISREKWMSSFTSIFQAMRIDHPGGAPSIGKQHQNVFKRIRYGVYVLIEKNASW